MKTTAITFCFLALSSMLFGQDASPKLKDSKKLYSFLYNQSGDKWILEARLEGSFPVGSSTKHDGWRDIVTQEHIEGTPPDHTLMRTYRRTKEGWIKIEESTASGG